MITTDERYAARLEQDCDKLREALARSTEKADALLLRVAQTEGRLSERDRENAKLRAFIESLDGKMICIMGDGDTVIDDGIIVASDILNSEAK